MLERQVQREHVDARPANEAGPACIAAARRIPDT
jgi:hypothetical protein